ncbi:amidohydrolase [Microbacterium sp. CIAB417]|uniref:amidohydrolase family protein n=1 Tax=Microbacterium sp. CIAB417 TaxID=2860287 RepID=UPI001FAB55A5|nr:amidohydrolase family protein [Microbacterium sp. CIAB417]
MRILDSHLHLWDPSRLEYSWLEGPLRTRFAVDEILAARGGDAAEHAAVFVQAECAEEQYLDEVAWVGSIAERVGVRGIVAGARLDRGEETRRYLDVLATRPLVVGVRHLLQGAPVGFAGTEAFRAGAAELVRHGLTFDACVRGAAQLRDVIGLAAAEPGLRIVLDHLGKPEVGTATAPLAPSAEWADAITELAAHPQVSCKLSGLPAEAGGSWSAVQVEPFLDVVASAFGGERIMIGSDWPVSAVTAAGWSGGDAPALDAAAIPAWTDTVARWATARDLDADAILWRNAARFYGLG